MFSNEEMIAFAIIKKENGYLPQFGMHPDFRTQDLGNFLFHHLSKSFPIVKIINVDASADYALKIINEIDLENSINQYEMVSYL